MPRLVKIGRGRRSALATVTFLALALWSCTPDHGPSDLDASIDASPEAVVDPVADPESDPPVDPPVEDVLEDDPPLDPPEPECGNGLVEEGEACDIDPLRCDSLDGGWVAGEAPCVDDCLDLDTTGCLTLSELEQGVREAARMTGQAQLEIMALDLVGMYEWEVKEIIDASYAVSGADDEPAFPHIVASGPNALELHYFGGDRLILDGDLVLVDIGARSGGVCGDVTRTIPANGTFTDRQRELYQLVLDAQTQAAAVMRPGVHSLDDMYFWTVDFLRASDLRALDEYGAEQTMDVFFIHGLSHYIALDVHAEDLGWDSSLPAQLGQVFSIEPGLYIPSEGIGIRIEDDYVLTETGAANLHPTTPVTVADIESAMSGG